jgi:FkbM family methyltransferase
MKTRISYQVPGGERHEAMVIVNDPREKIQGRWANGIFYETQRHGMLNTVYRRFRGGTFIDIGAACGNHSLFFAACCQAKRVYAFEPVAALFEHLGQNIAANDFGQIHAYHLALGAQPGQVGMTPSSAPPERGGMLMSRVDERGADVPMQRLDDVLRDEGLTEIRCIKIDVEGYNLPVLHGARETIVAHRPAIFCECDTPEQFEQVNAYLSTLGYRVWQVDGKPFVMNHTPTYLWEFDQRHDLAIVITTYNRPEQLRRLLADLMADAGDLRVHCRVYNDRSERAYTGMPAGSATFAIEYIDLPIHHGKARYWQLINRVFEDLRTTTARYYLQLPDDVRLRPGFLANAIAVYEAIDDPDKIGLNLYLDNSRVGKPCWNPVLPRIEAFGDTRVFKTGWVDMVYLAEQRFFAALDYKLNPIPPDRWQRSPRRSSGVGAQISRRLKRRAFYQVRECFLRSEAIPSLMNPDRPAHEDLSVVALDPICCGVASIPSRSAYLRQAVASVLPFVDQLYVYLNDYPSVPAFLRHPKLTVFRSQDHGDLGDAGKFFAANRQRGFFLTIDDDIFYPESYVWALVNALRGYRAAGRRVAVGFHGKLMRPEVAHFYHDHVRLFHFAAALEAERTVHVLGTGTSAFHTDDLPISIADFSGQPNMADIYFSIACQKHDVSCIILPRPAHYLKPQPTPGQGTIWRSFRTADQAPTALYNSWKEWRIRG